MRQKILLFSLLFGLWLLLSGHFDSVMLSFGVVSALVCVYITERMQLFGTTKIPFRQLLSLAQYALWLMYKIVASNIDVAKRIWQRQLPISPTIVSLKSQQSSDFRLYIYANSITLTPGTITLEVDSNGTLEVHALCAEGAQDLIAGEMDSRIAKATGA